MPDIGKMENLKNMLVRLKPSINAFNSFFSTHTHAERLQNRTDNHNLNV